jgi:hypothetical protein
MGIVWCRIRAGQCVASVAAMQLRCRSMHVEAQINVKGD